MKKTLYLLLALFAVSAAFADGAYPKAFWIWAAGENTKVKSSVWLVRKITVEKPLTAALLTIAADSRAEVYLDGELLGRSGGWYEPRKLDLVRRLTPGEHLLAVRAEDRDAKPCCGVVAELALHSADGMQCILSDIQWLGAPAAAVVETPKPGALDGFRPAAVIAPLGGGTWGKRVKWPERGF